MQGLKVTESGRAVGAGLPRRFDAGEDFAFGGDGGGGLRRGGAAGGEFTGVVVEAVPGFHGGFGGVDGQGGVEGVDPGEFLGYCGAEFELGPAPALEVGPAPSAAEEALLGAGEVERVRLAPNALIFFSASRPKARAKQVASTRSPEAGVRRSMKGGGG